jgi:hypothetical protein
MAVLIVLELLGLTQLFLLLHLLAAALVGLAQLLEVLEVQAAVGLAGVVLLRVVLEIPHQHLQRKVVMVLLVIALQILEAEQEVAHLL